MLTYWRVTGWCGLLVAMACHAAETSAPATKDLRLWDGVSIGTGIPDDSIPGCENNGESLRASRANACSEPVAQLNCTLAVSFNGNATCTLTVTPSDANVVVTDWEFLGGGTVLYSPSSATTWSGPMVTSGTVVVYYELNGQYGQDDAFIQVQRRNWSWGGLNYGAQGSGGALDACIAGAGALALMSGLSCTMSNPGLLFTPDNPTDGNGFYVGQVSPGGPNGGLHYVGSATTRMNLRTEVAREFRPDGLPYPMNGSATLVNACHNTFGNYFSRSTYIANTQCLQVPDFSQFLNDAWAHEAAHMNAALSAGLHAAGDLHLQWEPLVSETRSRLISDAQIIAIDAHSYISQQANSTHTGNQPVYWFYRYLTNGWTFAGTQVID